MESRRLPCLVYLTLYTYLGTVLLGMLTSSVLGQTINATAYSNLSCYQCMESFHKKVWNPYTDCQRFPTRLHLRRCGFSDRYCKVERVEWNGYVVTMERGCTDLCYWGCRYEGFGITRLRCTSCCNQADGCNTDNGAKKPVLPGTGRLIPWVTAVLAILL